MFGEKVFTFAEQKQKTHRPDPVFLFVSVDSFLSSFVWGTVCRYDIRCPSLVGTGDREEHCPDGATNPKSMVQLLGFVVFLKHIFQVELAGVEPASKQGNHTLSTRLFRTSFSSVGKTRTTHHRLSL